MTEKNVSDITRDLKQRRWIMVAGMAVSVAVMIPFMLSILPEIMSMESNMKPKATEKIFAILDNEIASSQPLTIDRIINLKEYIEKDQAVSISMIDLLLEYNYYLCEKELNSKEPSEVNEAKKQLETLIASEKDQEPFANLPEKEKRLFISLKAAITHNDDKEIDSNINGLSIAIDTRLKTHAQERQGSRTKAIWGIAIGVAGFVTGLLSAIFSIIFSNRLQERLMYTLEMIKSELHQAKRTS